MQNLQYEVAAALVPFLLWRKAMAAVHPDGSHVPPLGTLEDFLAEEKRKSVMYTGTGGG